MYLERMFQELLKKRKMTTTRLVVISSLFFVLLGNRAFFRHVSEVYPFNSNNFLFLASMAAGLFAATALILTLLTSRYTTKPVFILFIVLSSFSTYFMDNYDSVIDHVMIQNILETEWRETYDLLNFKILYYFFALGFLPSMFVYRTEIESLSLKKFFTCKVRDIFLYIAIILSLVLAFSKFYTSFFREHKPLRYYTNPVYYIYSFGKYINRTLNFHKVSLSPVGRDAKVFEKNNGIYRELVVLIVGEAARADHFSLNGYKRKTNPLLEKKDIVNFSNVYSCGTSTAYSVPCMFSVFPQSEFSSKKGEENENILDILNHTGRVSILWRDNNSDSKGVALRIPYEDYKTPELNTICSDGECRDEGMLIGLDQYIAKHKDKDILIVLHQMGNHGPAYYKRYPKEFEKFTPVCATNQIEECEKEEIVNSYDNALLYTDYFISKTIDFLEKYNATHETSLMYFSDHGESLGENGVYLHGLPYMFSPESQKHIGALMWFGDKINKDAIIANKNKQYSHDNLFHTLLGLFEVETEVYDEKLDMLSH